VKATRKAAKRKKAAKKKAGWSFDAHPQVEHREMRMLRKKAHSAGQADMPLELAQQLHEADPLSAKGRKAITNR
jgi:hypothetical protein